MGVTCLQYSNMLCWSTPHHPEHPLPGCSKSEDAPLRNGSLQNAVANEQCLLHLEQFYNPQLNCTQSTSFIV